MKKLVMISVLLALPFAAHAETASEISNAPFPAVVTGLDFDDVNQKFGCQLMTASNEDKIRLRWIPSAGGVTEPSVERMSVHDKTVQGRTKVAVTKLAEQDGVTVYGYREASSIVLMVPSIDSFATVTGTGDRLFMQQNCGLGVTILFTKPLASDIGGGCNTGEGKNRVPGFCGRLARLDGRISPTLSFSMSAGLGDGEKVRILIKTHATKPDGTALSQD